MFVCCLELFDICILTGTFPLTKLSKHRNWKFFPNETSKLVRFQLYHMPEKR